MYLSRLDEGLNRVDNYTTGRFLGAIMSGRVPGLTLLLLPTESVLLVACLHFTSCDRHLHIHYSNWCPSFEWYLGNIPTPCHSGAVKSQH